jgi:Post-segregation antitoxin CcdA
MRHSAGTRAAKHRVVRQPRRGENDIGKRREQWRRKNAEAIEEYNNFVACHGTFSDERRLF